MLRSKSISLRGKLPDAHLACAVEARSQGRQRHDDSPAVVAFDGIEGSDARQSPEPAQVFLHHVSQIAHIEGIPVVL